MPRRLAACLAFAAALALSTGRASALDLSFLNPFSWFSSKDEPPRPSAKTLPYKVDFHVAGQAQGDDADLTQALKDASNLYKLRNNGPPDGDVLARRALSDIDPMLDALWAEGYFNAIVTVRLGDVELRTAQDAPDAATRAAEGFRDRALVPVNVDVQTGPLFRLRNIVAADGGVAAKPPTQRVIGLKAGDPARASDIRAARDRIVDFYRSRSRPLARSVKLAATVDHPAQAMDVSISMAPGPVAGFGAVTISGTKNVPPEVVRSFVYVGSGEPYSPAKIVSIRKSVRTIPAIGSVRVKEADALDAQGNLPVFVDVTERPDHLIGINARFSSLDGPDIQPYFEHRNLFGGAERLRIEADGFIAPRIDGTEIKRFGDIVRSDIAGRISMSFLKPALGGSRFDLVIDALAERDRVGTIRFGGYTVRDTSVTPALRYRFSDTFYVQGGVTAGWAQSSDVLGEATATLVGTPFTVGYDSTDNPLDPTRGIKASLQVTPYPTFLGSTVGFLRAKASASTYYALDEDANYVIAARAGAGSLFGGDLADIPSNLRFYAGGGGSVRGFRYRTLSPMLDGKLTGGRSLLETSVEARVKITKTIEVVPFVDLGGAYASGVPNLTQRTGVGVGLGLRYLTSIGPIRVDLATPVNPRKGDRPLALYLGIGQAF